MLRPPRNLRTDRLMSSSMIVYCYCFSGFLNIAAGFIGYILAFNTYGLSLTDLFMSVQKHFIVGAEDFAVRDKVFTESEQVTPEIKRSRSLRQWEESVRCNPCV